MEKSETGKIENLGIPQRHQNQSPQGKKFGEFGINNIPLGTSDRRVLSSTIESLLSKDTNLTLITTCFFRDVLLTDFPPETFIQESSLCLSLLQVVKETWENPMVNYVAFQALMRLAKALRINIGFLDSPEFYQPIVSSSQNLSHLSSRSKDEDYSNNRSFSPSGTRAASTEYFLNNFFQLLTGLSRNLTYKPTNIQLWFLLETYSSLLQSYVAVHINYNTKSIHLSLEEVLLDISQCFLRNQEHVNPCIVATVMSSLLSCFDSESHDTVLTTDIRKTIWGLASNLKLLHTSYSFIRNHFIEKAIPFEQDLKRALDVNTNNFSVERFRSGSWWKLDMINDQQTSREAGNVTSDPTELISNILISIQRSTGHEQVIEAIDRLWENLLPLVFNKNQSLNIDSVLISLEAPWRESLYRFISVEPTSTDDEDLLARVLDITSFLLRSMKNPEKFYEWIVPLVTEKNAALLRVMHQQLATQLASSATAANTYLSTLSRSIFDFYYVMLHEVSISDQLGEFFNTCADILKLLYETDFPSTAIITPVLNSMVNLISLNIILEKLKEAQTVSLSLLEIVSSSIAVLCERTSVGSYRNRGGIHYGGLVLANLTNLLKDDPTVSSIWIGYCVPVIPLLWSIESYIIKASALQMCVNITSTEKGTYSLASALESPTLLWRYAYTRMTDSQEISIVRQNAAKVILNLMNFWDQMKRAMGTELEIPRLKLLEELSSMLTNVCWELKISDQTGPNNQIHQSIGSGGDANNSSPSDVMFVTPNVLSVCSRMIVKLLFGIDQREELFTANASLFRELCVVLSRVLGSYHAHISVENQDLQPEIWTSLTNTLQALITIVNLDKTLCLILIADRQNLTTMTTYFNFIPWKGTNNTSDSTTEFLYALWRNIFVLLSAVTSSSGHNFEDLERLVWSQRTIIFAKLIEWLDIRTLAVYRKSAIEFISTFLRVTHERQENDNQSRHFLCQLWTEPDETYGIAICKKLLGFLNNSLESDEQTYVLYCLNHLCLLSTSGKVYALNHQTVKKLVKSLQELGVKSADMMCNNRKNTKYVEQIKWILVLLTTFFCDSKEAKDEAILTNFADAIHTIFKFIKSLPDQTLLHKLIDCLINFTAEFPEGSQTLTLTTGLVGVVSRKVSTPNSLYVEMLGIFQSELDTIQRNPSLNFRTIELLNSFVNNTSCSVECRNILVKGKLLNFITRFHVTEIRKWSIKYPQLKLLFIKTLVQLTIYSDIQLSLSKIPDSIGILLSLSENEPMPLSLYSLQILRNLSFHNGNRPRLLHESRYLPTLASRLTWSDNTEEIECIGVALWAITANSEKGKVAVKRTGCSTAIVNSIKRLEMKEHCLAPGEATLASNLVNVINLLQKVSSIQNSCNSISTENVSV